MGVIIDRPADVVDSISRSRSFNSQVKALPGHVDELPAFQRNLADRKGPGCITEVTLQINPEIKTDDVPLLQFSPVWYPMNDHMIHRSTETGGISHIIEKSRFSSVFFNIRPCKSI